MAKYPASFETLEGDVRLAGEVEFTDASNQPGKGLLVPIADPAGVTVDSATYADPIRGGGAKLTTLVFPSDGSALAIALAGDAFPRWLLGADPRSFGLCAGSGVADPTTRNYMNVTSDASPTWDMPAIRVDNDPTDSDNLSRLSDVSPRFTIVNGALPTVQLVSGGGVQIDTTRDSELITPVTFNPTAGAAATCKIELSPDNATYSSLGIETEPPGVALDGTIHLVKVRVPAGWYVKATVVNAVLGLSTHY